MLVFRGRGVDTKSISDIVVTIVGKVQISKTNIEVNFKTEHSTAKDFAVSAFSHVSLGFGDTSGVCTDADFLELAQMIQEAPSKIWSREDFGEDVR